MEALVVISARSVGQLQKLASFLAEHAELRVGAADAAPEELLDLAYTLQVARPAMPQRLAIVTNSMADLAAKLGEYLAHESAAAEYGIYRGCARDETDAPIGARSATRSVDNWTKAGRLQALAQCWVSGGVIDWGLLPRNLARRRLALPLYPFAAEIHRFPVSWQRQAAPAQKAAIVAATQVTTRAAAAPNNVLHLTRVWRRLAVASSSSAEPAPATVVLFDTDAAVKQPCNDRPARP